MVDPKKQGIKDAFVDTVANIHSINSADWSFVLDDAEGILYPYRF